MKLKAFFRSIFATVKLSRMSDDQLGENARPAMVDVTISLTSIPSRLATLHLTIKSILNQAVSFERIILWLHEDLKDEIPEKLGRLQGERFEIRYSTTTEPHRKLVETLKVFPDRIIVTCDDDVIYPEDWLHRLLESWRHTPDEIVAHRCRKIRIKNGEIRPYRHWYSEPTGEGSPLAVAIGWGGVLFPPGCLDERVVDREAYMRLSPRADDLWYKAMAMLKGTSIRKSRYPYPAPIPIIGSQTVSLQKRNIGEDQNRIQLLALAEEYNLNFEE